MTNLQGVTDLSAKLEMIHEWKLGKQAAAALSALSAELTAVNLGWEHTSKILGAKNAEAAALAAQVAELTRERDEARRVAHKAIDMGQKAGIERMQAEAKVARLEGAIDHVLDGMAISAPEYAIDQDDDFLDAANTEWVRDTLTRLAAALTEGDTND
jgi:hypothetical protein